MGRILEESHALKEGKCTTEPSKTIWSVIILVLGSFRFSFSSELMVHQIHVCQFREELTSVHFSFCLYINVYASYKKENHGQGGLKSWFYTLSLSICCMSLSTYTQKTTISLYLTLENEKQNKTKPNKQIKTSITEWGKPRQQLIHEALKKWILHKS